MLFFTRGEGRGGGVTRKISIACGGRSHSWWEEISEEEFKFPKNLW